MSVGFGDNVRILPSLETEAAGVAGLVGTVFGYTTPSMLGVEVIGGAPDDFAISVFVKAHDEAYWLAPESVELVDHGVGTEMTVGTKRFIKAESGDWEPVVEAPSPGSPHPSFAERIRRFLRWA